MQFKWTYKQDKILQKIIKPFSKLTEIILEKSWNIAHYKNGLGSVIRKNNAQT